MSRDIEIDKCNICGNIGPVERTYYNYPVKCECHSPIHFEIVRHCKDCVATEPTETKITVKTSELHNITVESAMKVLIKALKEDKAPGSYYHGWQSNLACTIMDYEDIDNDQANKIAKSFLELLIKE